MPSVICSDAEWPSRCPARTKIAGPFLSETLGTIQKRSVAMARYRPAARQLYDAANHRWHGYSPLRTM